MGIKHYQEKNARAMEKEFDTPVKRKIQKPSKNTTFLKYAPHRPPPINIYPTTAVRIYQCRIAGVETRRGAQFAWNLDTKYRMKNTPWKYETWGLEKF